MDLDLKKYIDYQLRYNYFDIAPTMITHYKYAPTNFWFGGSFYWEDHIRLSSNCLFRIKKREFINGLPYYKWFDIVDDYRAVSIDFYYPDYVQKGEWIKVYYKDDSGYQYGDWDYVDWRHGDPGLVAYEIVNVVIKWSMYVELKDCYGDDEINYIDNLQSHQIDYMECLNQLKKKIEF